MMGETVKTTECGRKETAVKLKKTQKQKTFVFIICFCHTAGTRSLVQLPKLRAQMPTGVCP